MGIAPISNQLQHFALPVYILPVCIQNIVDFESDTLNVVLSKCLLVRTYNQHLHFHEAWHKESGIWTIICYVIRHPCMVSLVTHAQLKDLASIVPTINILLA